MSTTAEQRFRSFVEEPTPRRFRRLQVLVMADPEYDPLALPVAELGELFQRARYHETLECASDLSDVWQLSPRVHFYAGVSAEHLGDDLEARQRRAAVQACLRGLLATGDGTRKSPFLVTYLTDEADVMRALDQTDIRCQQLVETGSKRCDVITCHDGSDIWFDVSPLLARMPRGVASSLAYSRNDA